MTDQIETHDEAAEESMATLITDDGLILDPATGEVICADLPEGIEPPAQSEGARTGATLGFVEWVLSKIHARHAIRAARARQANELRAQLQSWLEDAVKQFNNEPEVIAINARIASLDSQAARASRGAEFLESAYLGALGDFARSMLAGQKVRTWQSPSGYGAIALTKQQPGLEITDAQAALAFAKEHAPFAVVESVSKKEIKKGVLNLFAGTLEIDPEWTDEAKAIVKDGFEKAQQALYASNAFQYTPASDKVTIKTGVQ